MVFFMVLSQKFFQSYDIIITFASFHEMEAIRINFIKLQIHNGC